MFGEFIQNDNLKNFLVFTKGYKSNRLTLISFFSAKI